MANNRKTVVLQRVPFDSLYFHLPCFDASFFVHGSGVFRCEEPHHRPPANLLRRQPMDYHPTEEDEYRIEHPSVGRSAKDNREVQGNDTGRACFPHAEQYHLQQDTERDRQAVRFQGAFDLSHGKA